MSKRYQEIIKQVDRRKLYSPGVALDLVKATAKAKFPESVDLAMKLNVDTKKGGVSIRGTISLPHGSGKSVKVAVLCKGDKTKEAEEAGADVVGAEDLVQKISGGFLGFDVLIATPDMMGAAGKLGKILGTKGLMPNPKSGTVTADIGKTVKEFKAGKFEFRMDKGGVVHLVLGKAAMEKQDLLENLKTAVLAVNKTKPSGTKGAYLKSLTLSSTMGPGVRLDAREMIGAEE
ncbi:50S ribosomal protein L1 [Candidatus Saganbacteria bacterium]|nr:50S ribosomal protein L1 [Candidatus Saganbacteria bacterium]